MPSNDSPPGSQDALATPRPSRLSDMTREQRREEAIHRLQLKYDLKRGYRVRSPYWSSLAAIRSTRGWRVAYGVVPWRSRFAHLRRAARRWTAIRWLSDTLFPRRPPGPPRR
jgi:hypothetical protein